MSRRVVPGFVLVCVIAAGMPAEAQHWPQPLVSHSAYYQPPPAAPTPRMPPPAGLTAIAPPPAYGPPMVPPPPAPPGVVYGEYPYHCDTCEPAIYTAFKFGFAEPDDQTIYGPGLQVNSDTDGGSVLGAALGRTHSQTVYGRLRTELEFMYRNHDIDQVTSNTIPMEAGGDFEVYSGMANLIWDIRHADSVLYPYLGIGAGVAVMSIDSRFGTVRIDDSEAEAALQLIAGAVYEWKPNVHLFVDGRYFATRGPDFDAVALGGPVNLGPTAPGAFDAHGEYHSMGVTLGIMFLWGPNRGGGGIHFDRNPPGTWQGRDCD